MLRLFAAPSRRSFLCLAGAVLGALCLASPVRAQYTLDLTISDNKGHSFTTPTSGPFTGGGNLVFTDLGVIFPEFTLLNISVTSDQAGTSFLNDTDLSGILARGQSGVNLTAVVTAVHFTSPAPLISAFNTLSSSTTGSTSPPIPPAFSSGSVAAFFFAPGLVGTVPTMTLGPPPYSGTSPTVAGINVGSSGYSVEQDVTITGLTSRSLSLGAFNNTATTNWAGPTVVPLPPGLVMALLGAGSFLGLAWVRRRRVCAA
jgi:hypothetical protein